MDAKPNLRMAATCFSVGSEQMAKSAMQGWEVSRWGGRAKYGASMCCTIGDFNHGSIRVWWKGGALGCNCIRRASKSGFSSGQDFGMTVLALT